MHLGLGPVLKWLITQDIAGEDADTCVQYDSDDG